MIRQEWKNLLKNRIMIVVLIAILMIPFLYAGLFLKSMWDPYGSMDHLPVAVVNLDIPAAYEGETLSIGADMVDALRDNDSLNFQFMDSASAQQGLKKGSLYMVITIPENFSRNAATLLDANPQKMELLCQTNPGTNYIASKMGETALEKIRGEIASQVTETYTKLVFAKIADTGNGLEKAADGSSNLYEGIREAANGSGTLTQNLKALADSTLVFSNGADTFTKGLREYTDGVSQVQTGAAQVKEGADALMRKLPQLTGGVQALDGGIRSYTGGVAALNEHSAPLLDGLNQLASGSDRLQQGTETLKTSADTYVRAVDAFSAGAIRYVQGTEQLADGAQKLTALEHLGQVSESISQLNAAVSEGDGSLKNGTTDLTDGLALLYQNLEQMPQDHSFQQVSQLFSHLTASLPSLSGTLSDAASQIGQAQSSLIDSTRSSTALLAACTEDGNEKIRSANSQLQNARQAMTSSLTSLESLYSQLAKSGSVSEDALLPLRETIQSLEQASGSMQEISEVNGSGYAAKAQQIMDSSSGSITALNETLTSVRTQLQAASASLDAGASQTPALPEDLFQTLTSQVGALYAGAQQIQAGTFAVSDALGQLTEQTSGFPEAAQGIHDLTEGFDTLLSSGSALKDGADQLNTGGNRLTGGVQTLYSGSAALSDGITALESGILSYADGISSLAQNSSALKNASSSLLLGTDMLAGGASRLSSGTDSLANGTSKLVQSNAVLNSGASSLDTGARQLFDGSSQLYDASQKLVQGMNALKNGADTLTASLSDGARESSQLDIGDPNMNMFSSPVITREFSMTAVENNGHAMAPYMMSVGLWVGALAFCLMYPLTNYHGTLKSGLAWWASKATVLYPVAILQGILLIGLLRAVDGFAPAQLAKTILFSCLTAVTFTSIMYFFNITLGKIGSFLMLIFMVVQLAGSAGTYPVELSPAFVSRIHTYLPFTYTVNAFRSTICAGESIHTSVLLLTVLTLVFTLLTILQFHRMARRRQKGKKLLIDWLEEKGLA